MTVDEIKGEVTYEAVLEMLCVTAYNGTRLLNPVAAVLWPSWAECTPVQQERFRQSVYLTLERTGNAAALEKLFQMEATDGSGGASDV